MRIADINKPTTVTMCEYSKKVVNDRILPCLTINLINDCMFTVISPIRGNLQNKMRIENRDPSFIDAN